MKLLSRMTPLWMFAALGVTLALAATAYGVERFPPPQFDSPHELPTTKTPPPDAGYMTFVDMGLLAVALIAGALLVLYWRSRWGVLTLAVLCLAYFGFIREGCVCSIGAIQNVSASLFGGATLPIVVATFFLLPIITTVVAGRVFCSGVCPLGAIQDIVALKPLRIPAWLDHGLGLAAYLYLGAAVLLAATGSGFIICQYDPFVGLFRMSGSTFMIVLGGVFLVAGIFAARPYCRWFCPYGVILSWISPGAVCRPEVDPVGCVKCHLCRDSCPVGAIDIPDEQRVDVDVARQDRRRMGVLLLLTPVIIAIGAAIGWGLATPFSFANGRVQLEARLNAEDAGRTATTTEASDAFRKRGESREQLTREVQATQAKYAIGTPILGAFMGLVIVGKLIQQSRRPKRDDYRIDQTRCIQCARCFKLCPHHPGNEQLLVQVSVAAEGRRP